MSFESPRERISPRSPSGKNDLILSSKKDLAANSIGKI
jgi:hypothetical protein